MSYGNTWTTEESGRRHGPPSFSAVSVTQRVLPGNQRARPASHRPERRDPLRRLVPTPGPGARNAPRTRSVRSCHSGRAARKARPPPNTRTRTSSQRRAVGALVVVGGGGGGGHGGIPRCPLRRRHRGRRMSPVALCFSVSFPGSTQARTNRRRSAGPLTEFSCPCAARDGHNRPILAQPISWRAC